MSRRVGDCVCVWVGVCLYIFSSLLVSVYLFLMCQTVV